MALLNIHNLSKKLGALEILHTISLTMEAGQITAILGPNGAGKTTLLKTIIGFHKAPQADINKNNSIFFEEKLINQLPIHQRVQQGITYLAQQTSLFQQMNIQDNLELVYEYHPHWQGKERTIFITERDNWLSQTELTHTLLQRAKHLSGGQKRKLEIVRTLLMHPKLILLDEPFAGVDPKSIYELKKIFTHLANKKISILISDHHVDQLLSIASTIYVILQGRVVTSGTIKEILENNHLKDHYLGAQFYQEIAQRFLKTG